MQAGHRSELPGWPARSAEQHGQRQGLMPQSWAQHEHHVGGDADEGLLPDRDQPRIARQQVPHLRHRRYSSRARPRRGSGSWLALHHGIDGDDDKHADADRHGDHARGRLAAARGSMAAASRRQASAACASFTVSDPFPADPAAAEREQSGNQMPGEDAEAGIDAESDGLARRRAPSRRGRRPRSSPCRR